MLMIINEYSKEGLTFIEITNNNNFVVTLCNLGASIYSIKKNDTYLTLTPKEVHTFKERFIYHGKTIGRVANRIDKGEVVINNKTYKLDINERNKTLHGGKEGFSNKIFDYEIDNQDEMVSIKFHYFSQDKEGGFPGSLDTNVTYVIYKNRDEIYLSFIANADQETIIGLTNHTYFSLGRDSINDLSLSINADKYIYPNPKDLIPIREIAVNNVMDFRKPKQIKANIDDPSLKNGLINGYDHHYCFNNVETRYPQITLQSDKYKLDIYTDFNGVQIYTDNAQDKIKWFGTDNKMRRGIAIEPQDNILERKILKKNEVYKRFIRYCFQ